MLFPGKTLLVGEPFVKLSYGIRCILLPNRNFTTAAGYLLPRKGGRHLLAMSEMTQMKTFSDGEKGDTLDSFFYFPFPLAPPSKLSSALLFSLDPLNRPLPPPPFQFLDSPMYPRVIGTRRRSLSSSSPPTDSPAPPQCIKGELKVTEEPGKLRYFCLMRRNPLKKPESNPFTIAGVYGLLLFFFRPVLCSPAPPGPLRLR